MKIIPFVVIVYRTVVGHSASICLPTSTQKCTWMGTETNAFNRGSYCREASVGKVKYFLVYSLRFCVPCVSLLMAWMVPWYESFIFGDLCRFLNISSRMLDDLILNVHHLPEIDLLYNSQVILNHVSSPI